MANDTSNLSPVPAGYKRCSRGDECVHPDGPVLPATTEYFHNSKQLGLSRYCKACDRQKKRAKVKDTPCPVCGNPVPARQGRYCSRECYSKDPNRPHTGPKPGSISWNRGLSAKTNEGIARAAQSKLKNVVDKDTLYKLYTVQNRSLKDIGNMFGVTKRVIGRLVDEFRLERIPQSWQNLTSEIVRELYESGMRYVDIAKLYKCSHSKVSTMGREAGIEARHTQNKAGIEQPEPELLRKLYWEEWLNYQQIADIIGVDMSTIPYWLKKLDIPQRTAWESRRGKNWVEPDHNGIIHLYQVDQLSASVIGQIVGVSSEYIKRVLNNNGIALRKSGYPNVSHYTARDGHKVKSGLELQVDNWLSDNAIPHIYEPFIGQSRYKSDFLIGNIYIEIWGITGNESYAQKRNTKLDLYARLGLNLISLYPENFPDLMPLRVLLPKNVL